MDAAGKVHLYDLDQQAALTSPRLWDTFTALGHSLKQRNAKVSFFSATPQGGGVALMRNALMRVWSASTIVKRFVCHAYPELTCRNTDRTRWDGHQVVRAVGRLLRLRHREFFPVPVSAFLFWAP